MKLLALDTSGVACSVALLIDDKVLYRHEIAPMQQAQKILSIIHVISQEANLSLNQLDALIFGCGPGSFTGVRIATSVVQGLGFALKLPVIPISSLAGLAQAAYTDLGWKKLLVGVDARIQEVYWGAYQLNPAGLVELVGKEEVAKPEEIHLPMDKDWYGVGNAWEVYRDQIRFQPLDVDASRLPTALGILELGKVKAMKGEWIEAIEASPTYLRDEVAKKSN